MINAFFPIILGAEGVKDSMSKIYNFIIPILVVIDFIFLLYVVFGSNANLNVYDTLLLLSHGSIIAGIRAAALFGVSVVTPVIVLIVLISYYFLCKSQLFVTCVTVFNTTMMLGIVVNEVFARSPFLLSLLTGSILIAAIIFGFLAFTRFKLLEKLHNVFVCYIVIGYLIRLIWDMIFPGTEDIEIQGLPFFYITQVLVFAILVFVIFIRNK